MGEGEIGQGIGEGEIGYSGVFREGLGYEIGFGLW